jgi:predicted amidophosphoribosyltransferase
MPVQGGSPQIVRSAQDSLPSHDTAPARSGQCLDDVKKEHARNQATSSTFSDKFCPCCGEVVKRRRPNAIFCCSGCLEQFHRDRKCGAAPIKRRPKRRRFL